MARLVVVLLVCGFSPFVFGQPESEGTLTTVDQYGGSVYFLTIECGSGREPVRAGALSPAEPAKLPEKTTTTEHGRGGGPIPVRVTTHAFNYVTCADDYENEVATERSGGARDLEPLAHRGNGAPRFHESQRDSKPCFGLESEKEGDPID